MQRSSSDCAGMVARLFLMAWFCLSFSQVSAAQDSKVALIIANSRYLSGSPLKNPGTDASLIRNTLNELGFKSVRLIENASREVMERELRAFSTVADQADVAMVYYAGHGMELHNSNYLIPVDARIDDDRDIEVQAVKLETVQKMVEGARRLRIVILDACRNNPFAATMARLGLQRSAVQGLAPVEPSGESLVVYAAKHGNTAADGNGQNSPFATALSRRLLEPGSEILLTFRKVRDDVLAETDGRQEPFVYGSLSSNEFFFRPQARPTAPGTLDVESEAWNLCRSSASGVPCDAYRRDFPNGKFVALAAARLADLKSAALPVPIVAAASLRPAAPEFVPELGLHVQPIAGQTGILVASVDSGSPLYGNLLAGDVIAAINSSQPDASVSPARALAAALVGRAAKLLVKRGNVTTLVMARGR